MPKSTRKPRGLIFDFDNTLYHADAAYEAALAHVGITSDDAKYAQARKAVKAQLSAGNTQRHNRLLYFKAMQPRRSPLALLQMMQAYETHLEAQVAQQWQALGRPQMFARWAQHYPIVILTNENVRTQLIKWRACDPLGTLFKTLICSEEVGAHKPHVSMFAAACAALQLPPEHCLMVGDSLHDDIMPALKLGMAALQTCEFLPANAPRHEDAAHVLPTLDRLDKTLCP